MLATAGREGSRRQLELAQLLGSLAPDERRLFRTLLQRVAVPSGSPENPCTLAEDLLVEDAAANCTEEDPSACVEELASGERTP